MFCDTLYSSTLIQGKNLGLELFLIKFNELLERNLVLGVGRAGHSSVNGEEAFEN